MFFSALWCGWGVASPRPRKAETNGEASWWLLVGTEISLQTLQTSPVKSRHVGDDREPETAVALLTTGRIEAMKGLKRLLPFAGWHAFTLVPDFDAAA